MNSENVMANIFSGPVSITLCVCARASVCVYMCVCKRENVIVGVVSQPLLHLSVFSTADMQICPSAS